VTFRPNNLTRSSALQRGHVVENFAVVEECLDLEGSFKVIGNGTI